MVNLSDLNVMIMLFAIKKHGDQKYGDLPYVYHLVCVMDVLLRFGYRHESWIGAAWAHDLLEDTDTTREELRNLCGSFIEELVFAVTSEKGKNRKERNQKTYPKTRNSLWGIALKLSDRIANVEHSKANNAGLYQMYKKEYPEFREALYTPSSYRNMWDHLDKLMED